MRTSNPAGTQICNNQCVNIAASDAANCGSCGHGCAGGACSGGQCQALSLGTIASADPRNLVLSGGYLYAITAGTGAAPSVWQLNPNAASTPVSIAPSIASPTSPRCVMDGKIFWAALSTGKNLPTPIKWCSVANCTATTATLLTSPGQAENPICDTTADELVWVDSTYPFAGSVDSVITIYRVAANGSGMRTMTSFYQDDASDYFSEIGIPNGRSDRYFFVRQVYTPAKQSLFYVPTNSVGVSPVQIGTGTPGQNGFNPGQTAWANDTLFVWNDSSGFNQTMYDVPLPNGVTGAAPVFYQGYVIDGIMDSQTLYGAFTTLPTDAIGKCALSSCTNPSVLFRGQQNVIGFTQDSSAIYWSTRSATGSGFTVWKGAK